MTRPEPKGRLDGATKVKGEGKISWRGGRNGGGKAQAAKKE